MFRDNARLISNPPSFGLEVMKRIFKKINSEDMGFPTEVMRFFSFKLKKTR